jgi:hypothetical protein
MVAVRGSLVELRPLQCQKVLVVTHTNDSKNSRPRQPVLPIPIGKRASHIDLVAGLAPFDYRGDRRQDPLANGTHIISAIFFVSKELSAVKGRT